MSRRNHEYGIGNNSGGTFFFFAWCEQMDSRGWCKCNLLVLLLNVTSSPVLDGYLDGSANNPMLSHRH